MKTAIIKQAAGLGDILFCQKIAITLQQKYNVVWPVISQFLGIKSYLPHINFVDINSNFEYRDLYFSCPKGRIIENNNCIIIGIDGTVIDDLGIMTSKYKLVGIDYVDWLDYFKLNRNHTKENELFHTILQLKDTEEYIVTNDIIGSPGHESKWIIPHPTDKKIIKVQQYDGYEVFDWCKVFENCSEFHIIDTCISYIIEKIKTTENVFKMYHRCNSSDKSFIDFKKLYKKPQSHIGSENLQPPVA
jgi:hypothetical protein